MLNVKNFFLLTFPNWLRRLISSPDSKMKELEAIIQKQDELIKAKEDLVNALEVALVRAEAQARDNFFDGRETTAALLMATGGEAFISSDIIEIASGNDYEIKNEQTEGGVMMFLTPSESERCPDCGGVCDTCEEGEAIEG